MKLITYAILLLPLFFSTSWAAPAPKPGDPLCYRYEKTGNTDPKDLIRVHPNCLTDIGKRRATSKDTTGDIDFSSSDTLDLDDYIVIDPKNRKEDIAKWGTDDDERHQVWMDRGTDTMEGQFIIHALEGFGAIGVISTANPSLNFEPVDPELERFINNPPGGTNAEMIISLPAIDAAHGAVNRMIPGNPAFALRFMLDRNRKLRRTAHRFSGILDPRDPLRMSRFGEHHHSLPRGQAALR